MSTKTEQQPDAAVDSSGLVGVWTPIQSAPKDGTEIDVWTTSYGRVTNAKWHKGHWCAWGYAEFDNNTWGRLNTVLTHWMPVPHDPDTPTTEVSRRAIETRIKE